MAPGPSSISRPQLNFAMRSKYFTSVAMTDEIAWGRGGAAGFLFWNQVTVTLPMLKLHRRNPSTACVAGRPGPV